MLTTPIKGAIKDTLVQTACDNTQIRKFALKRFSMGETAPCILKARLLDHSSNDMAFDLEMLWKPNVHTNLKMQVVGWSAEIPSPFTTFASRERSD